MALTATQLSSVASIAALNFFVNSNQTAIYNTNDLVAVAQALDNALDTPLNTAVTVVGGSTTVINGLAAIIPAPFSGASSQQKTMLLCWVAMKRVGLI